MDPSPEQVEAFGTAARHARKNAGLSATAVAERMSKLLDRKVKHQSVTAWERGEYGPQDYVTAKALDDVLECNSQLVAILYANPPAVDEVKALREEVAELRRRLEQMDTRRRGRRGVGEGR